LKLTFLEHIMALVLLSFFTGALCGFVGGVLVVRNNKAKAEALDQKATAALDSLKK
jgi:hypothetical protein